MNVAVVQFPGSNCDHDAVLAVREAAGAEARLVWHASDSLTGFDAVILPGGFSHGDYLRCGAMASVAPVMREVARAAAAGMPVLGICNGFQVLCEAGLLPGALVRNTNLRFTCRMVDVTVERADTPWTRAYDTGERLALPVAHAEGNYTAGARTLAALEAGGQVVLRYAPGQNPNGSASDIAGICNAAGNVVGMMPHPERATSALLGSSDGRRLFTSLVMGALEEVASA